MTFLCKASANKTTLFSSIAAIILGLFTIVSAQAHEYKAGNLEIIHPWSRATVPTAKVAGGYFKIINKGDVADKLVKVTADLSDDVQIHEMAMVDGVMKMRHLTDGIDIPIGGDIEFKPGSYHIMFMDLKNGLKEGEKFKGKLYFEKAGEVEVDFKVEAMDTKSMNHDHPTPNNDQTEQAHDNKH
ncbi:copper chaperone PCu(A)C [Bartonella sp. HY038]|uniref:copper chaperone PCu(A)C n=1 Tax=Bartonella sp. HY038 TaxID=2759660 RepID=UPI0015FB4904|nr:copper chaperone PCu(A)C [Bartonella sp. HY038]